MIHPCICFFFGPCNCQTLSLVAYIRHRQLFLHHKNQITTNGLNKVPALLLFIFFIIYLFSISCYTRMYVTIQTLKKKKRHGYVHYSASLMVHCLVLGSVSFPFCHLSFALVSTLSHTVDGHRVNSQWS